MGWMIKQPNGKFCSMDCFGRLEFMNYTEQDVINVYIEKAKKDMANAEHFGNIIKYIASGNMIKAERVITDKELKSMGFDKPYKELVKFVPCQPLDAQYVSCDFATYGKCPNCGGSVRDGMGGKDEKCKNCGQLLKW